MREQLIKKAEIFPIEFIVRNIVTGSLTKDLVFLKEQFLKNHYWNIVIKKTI